MDKKMQELQRYSRTYNELKDFAASLRSSAFQGKGGVSVAEASTVNALAEKMIGAFIAQSGSAGLAAQALVGFQFLGLSWQQGVRDFRSNRYFLDAMGLSKMPAERELHAVAEKIEREAKSTGLSFEGVIESYIDLLVERSDATRIPEVFRSHPMPSISSRDWQFLDEQGYLIVEGAIPISLCDRLQQRVTDYARLEAESSRGGYFYGSGKMQRVYQLLGKDELFRDLLLHPMVHQVMSTMFMRTTYHDKYYLTSFHANILRSGAESQIWHVDANVPEPLPSWIIRSNSNYVTQDYTEENGVTEIVPGSHKFFRKPNKQEAEGHRLSIKKLTAPKGSIIFWHGHLWHRSGPNNSTSNRVALLAAYAASHFREVCMEENPYMYLSKNQTVRLSAQLKRILGWDHGVKDFS